MANVYQFKKPNTTLLEYQCTVCGGFDFKVFGIEVSGKESDVIRIACSTCNSPSDIMFFKGDDNG